MLASDASTDATHLAPTSAPSNGYGVPCLRHIDPHENFATMLHGSSSCGEDRLGHSEQPSKAQCRASHLGSVDIRSYGLLKARFAAVRMRVADGPPQRIGDKGQKHDPGDRTKLRY